MGEAFWAAREGDALLHTSFLADLVGSALEFAINAAIDFAALAVVALATGATVATLGCSAVLLVGTVVGATMLLSGAGEKISKACEDIANSLFPPKIEGYILTGSGDTRINSKRAARAAATALSRHDVETLDAQAQAEAEEEKRRQDAKSMWDVAGEYLDAVKGRAENMAKGVVSVVSRMGSAEGWASLGNDALAEAGDMLSDTGHFISEMWQPTVATAYPGSDPKQDDKIDCHKHPSSFSQFMAQKLQALTDDPVGTVLGAMNLSVRWKSVFRRQARLSAACRTCSKATMSRPQQNISPKGRGMCVSTASLRRAAGYAVPARQKWWMSLRTAYMYPVMYVSAGRFWWYGISKAVSHK